MDVGEWLKTPTDLFSPVLLADVCAETGSSDSYRNVAVATALNGMMKVC